MIRHTLWHRSLPVLVAFLLALTACGGGGGSGPDDAPDQGAGAADDGDDATASTGPLTGTFALEPGRCADGGVTEGSWFRMVQTGGTIDEGPFVSNGDSPCGDQTWVPLQPGTDGGLITGTHQPAPDPAFDGGGNALADAIAEPTLWFAVAFGVSTNPVDPQTGIEVTVPTVEHDGSGALSADLRSFAASWNGQHFNQGSPKPDGSLPGNTAPVTGTYDPGTGRFMLTWTSQVVGGPFNNFTGVWRLEGTFTPVRP